jgi:hypothetical protein
MRRERKLGFQGRFDEAREVQEANVQRRLAEEGWQSRMRQLRERQAIRMHCQFERVPLRG